MLTLILMIFAFVILLRVAAGVLPILILVWLGVTITDRISVMLTGELPAYRQDYLSGRSDRSP